MTDAIARRGGRSARLSAWPPVGVDLESDGRGRIAAGPLADITSIWFRRYQPATRAVSRTEPDFSNRSAWAATLESLWLMLEDRYWINRRHAEDAALCKPVQLQRAAACGLDVPRSLVTNDPERALAFVEDHGRCVYKPLTMFVREEPGVQRSLYTTAIRASDIRARSQSISAAPCLLQEHLDKVAEWRVTVMAGRLFASRMTPKQRVFLSDWRSAIDALHHETACLPAGVHAALETLVAGLGLELACIDLAETRDGRIVFLDLNPNGQWYWVEQRTGLPLLEHFVDMLLTSGGAAKKKDPALSRAIVAK